MGKSLKEFARILSRITGLSPAAIYERQRELLGEGLLVSPGTRGPGGGIRATPETVAILLTAILSADGRANGTASALKFFELPLRMRARPREGYGFGDELVALLRDPARAEVLDHILVHRAAEYVHVVYGDPRGTSDRYVFSNRVFDTDDNIYPMSVRVHLAGWAVKEIADELQRGALPAVTPDVVLETPLGPS
jgi:hypothetical protein